MKVSTRGSYGMRLMLDLALNYGGGPVSVRDIAARQELSMKYIEQLMASLKGASLVKAFHGANGGYLLARSPSEIRLKEVFMTLEGPINLVSCAEDPSSCPRTGTCATRDVWQELEGAISSVLDGKTLADMVERHRQKEESREPIYQI